MPGIGATPLAPLTLLVSMFQQRQPGWTSWQQAWCGLGTTRSTVRNLRGTTSTEPTHR